MSRPLHIHLTAGQRTALYQLRRDPRLQPRERDRVEMCLLSAAGWTVPRLAAQGIEMRPRTVRKYLDLMGPATAAPKPRCGTGRTRPR